MSFDVAASHLTQLQQIMMSATKEDVRGRWQPDPEHSWKDAWRNLSQCIDMAEAKAHHERAYEVEDRLIRFNCVLLRATHWVPGSVQGDRIRIHCMVSAWTAGKWKRYEQQVRGYHAQHFVAAMEDALQLNIALQKVGETFRQELSWLQCVMTYLPVTQQSMQYGESSDDASWADFCMSAASLDAVQQVLSEEHGNDARLAVEALRWPLWWSAARCEALGANEDMVTCLRMQRLLGSAVLPREAMRILPGDFLVVPVHIPVWNDEWDRVRFEAHEHLAEVEKGQEVLLMLLPSLQSRLGLREVVWIERALAILGSTVEILRLHGISQDFAAA